MIRPYVGHYRKNVFKMMGKFGSNKIRVSATVNLITFTFNFQL